MFRNLVICIVLVMAFMCAPAQAWDASAYGYPPNIVSILQSACFDPGLTRTNRIGWQTGGWGYYLWDHPRNNSQAVTRDLTRDSAYNWETIASYRYKYSSVAFGQWLLSQNLSITGNPFLNGDRFNMYIRITTDHDRFTADVKARFELDVKNTCINAGLSASDPRCNPQSTTNTCYGWENATLGNGTFPSGPISRHCADTVAYMVTKDNQRNYGPDSEYMIDTNGILRAYYGTGLAADSVSRLSLFASANPFVVMGSWLKPAECSATAPTATPVPPGPTPTPVPPVASFKCKNPATGECLPSIFGGSCPSGWVPCGATPTPVVTPFITPIPPVVTPIPGGTIACLSADGRYVRRASACDPDETPLRK